MTLEVPARALAIGAHPDDVEFGCGATLARWSQKGAAIDLCVLTDGSKGTWDPNADLSALVATRKVEQREAADALGIKAVHFFDLVDGDLGNGRDEQARVCALIRDVRPEVILGHDPWKRYRLHPDHRRAGEIVIDAIVAARDPHFFPELGPPHRPRALLLFEADVVDHLEDIRTTIDTKVAALLCHRSQWQTTMKIDAGSPDEAAQVRRFEARIRDDAQLTRGGAPGGLAEAFKLLTDL